MEAGSSPACGWKLAEDAGEMQRGRSGGHRLHGCERSRLGLLSDRVRDASHARQEKPWSSRSARKLYSPRPVRSTSSSSGLPRIRPFPRPRRVEARRRRVSQAAAQAALHRKSRRFALIEKKRGGQSSVEKDKKAQQTVLAAAVQSGDPLHGLLALQLAETMKRSRGKHRRRSPSTSNSGKSGRSRSSDSSGSSSESVKGEKGHSKAVHNYRKAGRRKFRHPLRHVRRFVKSVEEPRRAGGSLIWK